MRRTDWHVYLIRQDEGYDEIADWSEMKEEDLKDMGITKKGKIKKFLRNLATYQKGIDDAYQKGIDDGSLMSPVQKRLLDEICFKLLASTFHVLTHNRTFGRA